MPSIRHWWLAFLVHPFRNPVNVCVMAAVPEWINLNSHGSSDGAPVSEQPVANEASDADPGEVEFPSRRCSSQSGLGRQLVTSTGSAWRLTRGYSH